MLLLLSSLAQDVHFGMRSESGKGRLNPLFVYIILVFAFLRI